MKLAFPKGLLCSAVLLIGISLPSQAKAAELMDYIVAIVNEEVVLASELQETFDRVREQIVASRGQAPADADLRKQILERIIVTKVQVQRAAQGGLRLSDAELNQAMADIAARNGMNLNQFALALRRQGIDYLALRRQVHDDMLVNQLRQAEVEARINVNDEDVRLFLEQQEDGADTEYHLAHILLSVDRGSDSAGRDAVMAEAIEIVKQAREGADFGQLAIKHSDSPRALEGGDLGWRRGNELPGLFAKAVPTLKAGDVSDPIPGGGGIHIVKVVESRGADAANMVRETHARHILLKPNVLRNMEETRAEISSLVERIDAGEDFAAVAKEHSEDPGSANQGGDLGWQGPETFVPEFQRALDTLEPGEISPPFRTPFGWHVAQLIERRERDRSDELRLAQARNAIFKRKAAEEHDIWLRRLRDEAYVEYRDAPTKG